jgi:hypothetical protein
MTVKSCLQHLPCQAELVGVGGKRTSTFGSRPSTVAHGRQLAGGSTSYPSSWWAALWWARERAHRASDADACRKCGSGLQRHCAGTPLSRHRMRLNLAGHRTFAMPTGDHRRRATRFRCAAAFPGNRRLRLHVPMALDSPPRASLTRCRPTAYFAHSGRHFRLIAEVGHALKISKIVVTV